MNYFLRPQIRSRRFGIGAVAVVGALALSSCASVEAGEAQGPSDCIAADTTLSVMHMGFGDSAMAVATEAMAEKYPDLTIESQSIQSRDYADLTKQVVADLAVGKETDVIMAGLGEIGFWVDTYDAPEINVADLPDAYQTEFLDAGSRDGKVYLAPFQISAPMIAVNKDLLSSVGIEDSSSIKTHDDLLDAAKLITDKIGTPSASFQNDVAVEWYGQALVQASGGNWVNPDGTAAFDDQESIDALSLWSTAYNDGVGLNVGFNDGLAQFAAGNLGFYYTTTSQVQAIQDAVGGDFTFEAIEVPTVGAERGAIPAGGNGWMTLSQDACQAKFSNELIGELLSEDAVLAASADFSYLPVNTDAAATMLEQTETTQPLEFAWTYDAPLTQWGGFPGKSTAQINEQILTMVQQLSSGADANEVVPAAVETINEIATR